ncbi:thyroid hormone receptor-associated protein 3-like isoform X2 [Homarus americanus]|uniref:thyroid hormone receptor-associated protein 3-like isoform X2 n=1 Tax=Homarus americanus TaxID=6706 RepID=UPI001C43EB26|nr:thyroid hormone receptor-associated protein 3-like isoform X2 [Homarus americanus]
MENWAVPGEKNILAKKRHIQDDCGNRDTSPPKVMTTPSRSRGRTPELKDGAGSVSETSAEDRKASRTPGEDRNTPRTRSASRTPAQDRNTPRTRSASRTPAQDRNTPRTRSASRTPAQDRNTPKTRSASRTPAQDRNTPRTRSASRTPAQDRNTPRTRSASRTPAQDRNTPKTRSASRTPAQDRNTPRTRSASRTPAERGSTIKKKSSYGTPVLEKSTIKTQLFKGSPVQVKGTSKPGSLNRTPLKQIVTGKKGTPVLRQPRSVKESTSQQGTGKTRTSNKIPVLQRGTAKNRTRVQKQSSTSKTGSYKRTVASEKPVSKSSATQQKKNFNKITTPRQKKTAGKITTSDEPLGQNEDIGEKKESDNSTINGRITTKGEMSNCSDEGKENSDNGKVEKSINNENMTEVKQKEVLEETSLSERKKRRINEDEKEKVQEEYQVQDTETRSQTTDTSQEDSGQDSSVEAVAPSVKQGIQAEVEKVKRRRSTIGRGRKSIQSIGGRQSLCAALPALSLEDQISKIDQGLPWCSKVSHLIDISIREAMRILGARCPGDKCVSELRHDILLKSEDLAGEIAYKIAGLPLVAEAPLPNTSSCTEDVTSMSRMAAYKKKTKELEHEYKTWKTLLKERKLACQAAQREFLEAKSGETKIEEEQANHLSSPLRIIIASRPNYQQYLQEVRTVREKAVLNMQAVKDRVQALSGFITATKAQAKSCCSAVEMSFGYLKNQPTKTLLASLLQSHIPATGD